MYKNEIKKLVNENEGLERIVVECNDEVLDVFELVENNDFNIFLEDFIEAIDECFVVKSYDVEYNYITIYVEEV